MQAIDAIVSVLEDTKKFVGFVLADLSDADILVRPVPSANHIAWQLGHLIATEQMMAQQNPLFVYPPLPEGFLQSTTKEAAHVDPPVGFLSLDAYTKRFNATRDATIAGARKLTAEGLDQPLTGNAAGWAPNLGGLLLLNGTHTMMHFGQFSVVRRKLGKPVVF